MAQDFRVLNYQFAPKDPRDFPYAHIMRLEAPPSLLAQPRAIDLRPHMPPIYDQGGEGSCTAHAGVAHKEFLDMKFVPRVPMSRQFLYYCERVLEGDPGRDGGANMRNSCQVLIKTGVCDEQLWPYVESDLYNAPPQACYQAASLHKIGAFYQVSPGNQMRQCLANGFPFVFGLVCPRQLTENSLEQTGVMGELLRSDATEDGHALLCVGYDMDQRVYIIRNSWGADWGQAGYFTMPMDVMEDPFWVSDCYTMRLAHQTF